MRYDRLALLLGTTVLFATGCSSGRSFTNPFSSGGDSHAASASGYAEEYAGEYDNDPVGEANRVAIEPAPAPPARGISLTRTISHTTTVGRRRNLDGCGAGSTCAAPKCEPRRAAVVCPSKRASLLDWCSPWRKRRSEPAVCGTDRACAADPSCCTPRSSCLPQTACVPQRPCVQQYAQPLERQSGCVDDGCCPDQRCSESSCQAPEPQCRPQRACRPAIQSRGLFQRIFGGIGSHFRPRTGSYCAPASGCTADSTCAVPSSGCGGGEHVIVQQPQAGQNSGRVRQATPSDDNRPPRAQSYERCPLAEPMQDIAPDPFAKPSTTNNEQSETKTPVPAPPGFVQPNKTATPEPPVGKPLESDDVPDAPTAPPMPLEPMPGADDDSQAWLEPARWHRLSVPSSRSIADQERTRHARATGWSR